MNITPSIQQFFDQQNVEITLFPSKKVRKFMTVEMFVSFIDSERTFWNALQARGLNSIRQHFNEIYNLLDNNTSDEKMALDHLRLAIQNAKINRVPAVFSATNEAKFLKKLYEKSPTQSAAAYDYLFNGVINFNSYENFLGIISAFNLKDRDKILKTIADAEKETLTDLCETYNNQLNQLSTEFFSCSKQIKEEFKNIQENLDEEQKQFMGDTQVLLEKSEQRIIELENLYEEKLRLQSPAKYWDDLRLDYIAKGERWKKWSIGTSISFVLFLSVILYNSPQSLFEKFNFNSLKATIIFALITSIGIYMIRFFVKLSTSAYHLSRDAYERYQLTHVYLSLLESKSITENERSIVLQSIFSRADTGLLKGDSSPAFPGIMEQIIKNMKK